MKKETLVTTLGRNPEAQHGVVNPPVYRASTILFPTLSALEQSEKSMGINPLIYARSGTPSSRELEEALAALCGTDHAIITASGEAAIVVTLMAMLGQGDHLLITDSVYGTTRKFCKQELARLGVEITFFDPLVKDITPLLRPNTKLVYCESPGSLTFEMQDIPAIARAAHAHGAAVAADMTWATPFYFDAFGKGVDIAIHSCTKYVGGHSDLMMGLIACREKYFPTLRRVFRNTGVCAGADEIYLASRGLRTLATRIRQNEQTALMLAKWLKGRPEVVRVLHPAFPDCPGHDIWKRDFTGATGLFSVLLKPYPCARLADMVDHMEIFGMGFSWGGYESLILPFTPERTTKWAHDGINLRIYAGLEHPDDLIADLDAGFKRLNKA